MFFFWVKHFRQENRSSFRREFQQVHPIWDKALRWKWVLDWNLKRLSLSWMYSHPRIIWNLDISKLRKKGNIIKTVFDGGMDKNMFVWYGTATSYFSWNFSLDIQPRNVNAGWYGLRPPFSLVQLDHLNTTYQNESKTKESLDEVESTYYSLKFKNLPFKSYPLIQISKKKGQTASKHHGLRGFRCYTCWMPWLNMENDPSF